MGGWIEILFPIAEIDDPQTRAWYVDGGANQSWTNIIGSGGSFAPGAVPHQIGTDTILNPIVQPIYQPPAVFFTAVPFGGAPSLHRAVYVDGATLLQSAAPLSGVGSTPLGIYSIWYRQISHFPSCGTVTDSNYDAFRQPMNFLALINTPLIAFPFFSIIATGLITGGLNMFFNPNNALAPADITQIASSFNTETIDEDNGRWHHIIWSWDLSAGSPFNRVQCYVDGVAYRDQSQDVIGSPVPTTIDWTQGPVALFGFPLAVNSEDSGMIAEVYFAPGQFLDLSNPSNLAKFYSSGNAVELGSDGSLPTGTAPAVYLSGPLADESGFADWTSNFFTQNRGTGGTINLTTANPANAGLFSVDAATVGVFVTPPTPPVSLFGPAPIPAPLDPFP